MQCQRVDGFVNGQHKFSTCFRGLTNRNSIKTTLGDLVGLELR